MKKKQGGSGYCILPEAEFGCCAFLVWYILSSDSAKGDVVCAIIYSSQAKGKPWSHAKHVLNDHHFQNACKLSETIYEDLGAAGITFSEYHSKIRHRLLVREKYRFGYRSKIYIDCYGKKCTFRKIRSGVFFFDPPENIDSWPESGQGSEGVKEISPSRAKVQGAVKEISPMYFQTTQQHFKTHLCIFERCVKHSGVF